MNPKAFTSFGEMLVLARDLRPGDRIVPFGRTAVEEVASVELYGISASVTFRSGAAGSVMNHAQRLKLVVTNEPGKADRQRKRKPARQLGDLLPGGELVSDPTNALLELHDQANGIPAPQPAPEAAPVDLVQTLPWPTPAERVQRPMKPWDVVSGIYATKAEREAAKRRLRTLINKLQRLSDAERRAFITHLNTLFR